MNTHTKKNQIKVKIMACLIFIFQGIYAQESGFTVYPSDLSSSIFSVDDGTELINSQFKLSSFATGEPNVVAVSALVLIPLGTTIEVTVTAGSYELFSAGRIDPVQPKVGEGSNESIPPEEDYIDNTIYNSSSPFPGKFYEFVKLGTVRGHEFGVLYIYPYQYYPDEEKTYVYNNIQLDITYSGTVTSLPDNLLSEFDPIELVPINFDPIELAVINFDQVIELELAATTTLKSTQTYEEGCELMIITKDILLPAAERLQQYRESRGIETKIEALSGTVTPSDIDSYIESCYQNMDPVPRYILLLGDIDVLPASDQLAGKTTDLPYFDVDDESPMLPDFSSGRIPVSTLTDAHIWIDKIIAYEKIPYDDPFFSKAALVSFFRPVIDGCGSEYFRYIKTCEELGALFTLRGIEFDRLYYSNQSSIQEYTYVPAFLMHDDKSSAPVSADIELPNSYGFTWDKTHEDIIESMNSNNFLVVHRGHGSTSAWGTENLEQFSSTDIASLTNSEYPSVVWSLNCLTGKFDGTTDCISEKLGKYAGGGAVGIVAATDETETIYNDYMAHGLANAIWPEFQDLRQGRTIGELSYQYLRMGDVLRYSLINLINVSNNKGAVDPGALNHLISYHWLGDPTMEIIPNLACLPRLEVESTTVDNGEDQLYKNYDEIFVENIFSAENGASVEFIAGTRIVFGSGVYFKSGSSVKASTQECAGIIDLSAQKSAYRYSEEGENPKENYEREKETMGEVLVYPNPTSGLITVEFNKKNPETLIKIYNYSGVQVFEKYSVDILEQIDFSAFGAGIYMIRVYAGSTYQDKKVVVF